MAHVLVVEASPEARSTIERGLSDEGFAVSAVGDGEAGLRLAADGEVDLVLLDMTLPQAQGYDILRRVREAKPRLPIVALSDVDETGPMVIGLEAGADDYLTKPISTRRLAARVKAHLRRGNNEGSLSIGPVTLDLAAHMATVDGSDVELSAREVALLATFLRHEGEVLSRDRLLKEVWNVDFDPGTNVVSVYIRALRKKIGKAFIKTVRGRGYRFEVPQS